MDNGAILATAWKLRICCLLWGENSSYATLFFNLWMVGISRNETMATYNRGKISTCWVHELLLYLLQQNVPPSGQQMKATTKALLSSEPSVTAGTPPWGLPVAGTQIVARFHPLGAQCLHLPLPHQNNVQWDQKPFGRFLGFHDFEGFQFYPVLELRERDK